MTKQPIWRHVPGPKQSFTVLLCAQQKEQSTGGRETPQAAPKEGRTLKKKTQAATVASLNLNNPRPHVSLRLSPLSKNIFSTVGIRRKKEPFFLHHLAATYGTALNRGFMREGPQPTGMG